MGPFRIVLASSSPVRAQMIATLGVPYECVPSGADETIEPGWTAERAVVELAARKASTVLAWPRLNSEDDVVIGSDTVVALEDRILGKPRDEAEARATLRDLRGRVHRIVTGIAVLLPDQSDCLTDAVATEVRMREYAESEINEYVATGEPLQKAGSYAIQGGGRGLVAEFDGSFDSAAGLPLETLRTMLDAVGFRWPSEGDE